MDQTNENSEMARVAAMAVEAEKRLLVHEGVPMTVDISGKLSVMREVLDEVDARRPKPLRRTGTEELTELDSFVAHVNRYKEASTTIWANSESATFTAVYNDNAEGSDASASGWRDFQAKYNCPLAPEWIAWLEKEGQPMTQEVFADWLDERMDDLRVGAGEGEGMPAPVEMLEMARSLHIYTQGVFSKQVDPTTGTYRMICKEEHSSESTKIPRAFGTALRIFDGGSQYLVEMRIQFRLERGAPVFRYTVHRAKELQADAFGDMREKVAAETERPVFAGRV